MFLLKCLIYLIFMLVSCNGELKTYKANENDVILLNDQIKEDTIYSVDSEGTGHSDYLIFQYDGVSNWFHIITKLWSSVEVTLHSNDNEFRMKVANTIVELLSSGDKSHDNAAGSEHLQDALNHFIDAIKHSRDALYYFASYRIHNYDRSVKLNSINKQFVKVCYHGPKPAADFTVTVQDTAIDWKFPICLVTAVLILIFAHPISRNVNFLYQICGVLIAVILFPYVTIYLISRLCPRKLKCVSYSLLGAGWVSLTFLTYFVTLEQLFELPIEFIIIVMCLAVLLEFYLQPTTSLFKRFQSILGPTQFLWMLRCGAAVVIVVWSTQWYVASFILLAVICSVTKWLQMPRRSRPRS